MANAVNLRKWKSLTALFALTLLAPLSLIAQPDQGQGAKQSSSSGSPMSGMGGKRGKANLIATGEKAPAAINVYNAKREKVPFNDIFGADYTVVMTGCLTCPVFYRSYPGMEALAVDYADKGVNFYYLYKHLAHAENHGYVEAFMDEERLMQVTEARRKLQTSIPWLTDPVTDEVSWALGGFPNQGYIFDREGKVVQGWVWANIGQMRKILAELVGETTPVTTAKSLNLPKVVGLTDPVQGVVEQVSVEETLTPVRVKPLPNDEPFFVKLRAEVSPSVLSEGSGLMYLGFHLDPLHNVHWNNLAAPLEFDVKAPAGSSITPTHSRAPEVKGHASDIDPREFLVDVASWEPDIPIDLEVRYFACDDEDRWCYKVTQNYQVYLENMGVRGGVAGRSFKRPSASGMQRMRELMKPGS